MIRLLESRIEYPHRDPREVSEEESIETMSVENEDVIYFKNLFEQMEKKGCFNKRSIDSQPSVAELNQMKLRYLDSLIDAYAKEVPIEDLEQTIEKRIKLIKNKN